jgi:hypothetical protein
MDIDNKKIDLSNRFFVLVSLLVAGILICYVFQLTYQFKSVSLQNQNQITISGTGKTYAVPDVAKVTLGIETTGKVVKDITETNVTSMNKIIEGLKALGIAEKDIQTTQYSVNPQYDWTDRSGRTLTGYVISQNIEVKIRDFTMISDALNVATNNGANIVSSLQFTIDDVEKVKATAREKAIVQAKEKAQTLANQTGIKLGDIINVYENNDNYYAPIYSSKTAMGAGAMDAVEVAPQIQTGEQEVQITVSLTYKIK